MNVTEKIKKNFGFGFMRLPMKDGEVDEDQTCRMVDAFLDNGFNYFDTAHGYLDGKSEVAIKNCLTSRHARDEYVLANKLSTNFFKSENDIRPLFEEQLKICGVDYFDFYLMHAQGRGLYKQYTDCKAYEKAKELKAEGKIRHLGISFHDTADFLEKILSEHPEVEFVQLQINYLDFDDPAIQGRGCVEVCARYGKPIVVMEPVKGGNLVNLPGTAKEIIECLGGGSAASYALRFAAGQKGVMMVLSGMSAFDQMEDNIKAMKDFKRLDEVEMKALDEVVDVFHSMNLVPCTSCRYCTSGCPKKISIPDLFALLNSKKIHNDWNADYYYSQVHTKDHGKASECIKCGKCERICPQHLPIRALLEDVAKEFEK